MANEVRIAVIADDKASPVFANVEKKASGIGSTLATIGKAGILGLGGLGAAIGVVGVGFDNMKQQSEIAFTTMLGSGEKAKVFLDDLQKFAAATPFEFPELVSSSQKLLAMGFAAQDVIPTLTAIGDAVAGLGGSAELVDQVTRAMGQMKAKGKTSAEEMLQLTEAGIPAWQMLADAIGKDVPTAMDMVSKGAISADTTIKAVTTGMEKRFGGMMEKQSHTFGGLLSTLKDTFTQLAGTVMKPFFELMTKGMQKLVDLTSGPGFSKGIAAIGASLKGAFEVIGPIIDTLKISFSAMMAAFSGEGVTSDGIVGVFERIGVAGSAVSTWIQGEAIPALEKFGAGVLVVTEQAVGLMKTIARWVSESGILSSTLSGLGEIGRDLGAIWQAILPTLKDAANWLVENKIAAAALVGALAGLLIALAPIPVAIGAIIVAAGLIRDNWDSIRDKTLEVWGTISGFVQDKLGFLVAYFTMQFEIIKTIIETHINVAKDIINLFLDVIHGRWGEVWEDLKRIVADVLEGIKNVMGAAKDGIVGMFGGIWDGVKNAFKGAINYVIDGINSFLSWLRGLKIELPKVDLGPLGSIGGGSLGIPGVPGNIERLASGTPYVPRTGLAILHKGEAVVPADQNPFAGGGSRGGVYVDARGATFYGMDDFERKIGQAVRNTLLGGGLRDVVAMR